ncbi:hypothetical protein V490_05756 [Pseudogymnoascus sp. VKM F-3557]|nr:hypothetical protein V490_05756 [Pseudogymnoascus sp. VKM F-3557]
MSWLLGHLFLSGQRSAPILLYPAVHRINGQPISTFALAVQTLLYRPAPQAFAASTFSYPPADPARSLKEQQPRVVGRGQTRPYQTPRGSPTLVQDGLELPCPDLWDHKGPGDLGSMSQRPDASRPVSQSTTDGLNDRSPSDTFRGQERRHAAVDHGDESSREKKFQQQNHQPLAQPPAQHYSPMMPSDSRISTSASRGVGVHTMLNPTESGTNRASTFGSNSPMDLVDRSLPQQTSGADIPTPTSHLSDPRNSPGLFPTNASFAGRRRRSLAPNVHRSASLGNVAMGGQRPFAQPPPENERGRPHIAVPGTGASSEIPPVPAIPGHISSTYNLPPPVSGPSLDRRASVAVMGGPTPRLPNSQSASPNSPYSYNSYPSPAPVAHMNQPPPGPPYFTGSTPRGTFLEGGPSQGGHQESIPLMTDLIPIHVDVEVGSIEAGNKRKRNASASARFRARNKDKKQQESKEINDLENKLQSMTEERDFYRSENARLLQTLYDNPGTRDMALHEQRNPRFPPSSISQRLPPGPLQQPMGGDTSDNERHARRRRLHNEEEYGRLSNQPRPDEGQHMQYPPPTNPYAPTQSRPEGAQQPQYLPPYPRSVSGPVSGSNWLSNTSPPRPPAFYPHGANDRPWPTGQLPQLSQAPQDVQQQQQPQYHTYQQAQQQTQQQTQQQAQQQTQQQTQQPRPPLGDSSGQGQ